MTETILNNYTCTLSASINSSVTSMTLSTAASVASGFRILIDSELMQVTAGGTTTTWTVVRAIEGTTAAAHTSGAVVNIILTAAGLQAFSFPWYNLGDPNLVSFSWRNQGGATVTARNHAMYLAAPAVNGNNMRGQEIGAPSTPWSFTVGIIPQLHDQNYNTSGLYVSDGTKLITNAVSNVTNSTLAVAQFTNVTTFSSFVENLRVGYAITPIFLKVYNDATNLKWYWSVNGYDFILIYTATITNFLSAASYIGWYAESNNSTWPCGTLLVSWVQGTS